MIFNETKENNPGAVEVVTGMSTPEKLVSRTCESVCAPAKKRYVTLETVLLVTMETGLTLLVSLYPQTVGDRS